MGMGIGVCGGGCGECRVCEGMGRSGVCEGEEKSKGWSLFLCRRV